jgi:hypothetical protein
VTTQQCHAGLTTAFQRVQQKLTASYQTKSVPEIHGFEAKDQQAQP